jgi:hypothetical protein
MVWFFLTCANAKNQLPINSALKHLECFPSIRVDCHRLRP